MLVACRRDSFVRLDFNFSSFERTVRKVARFNFEIYHFCNVYCTYVG